jgi:hypothetical protein
MILNECMLYLFILFYWTRLGDSRRAVDLNMSIFRVAGVCDPRKIGCVPSQLVFNGAPICIEPKFQIIIVYSTLLL